MSLQSYSKWWIATKKDLKKLKETDKQFTDRQKVYTNRDITANLLRGFYTQYSMLIQDMSICIDQLAQPQQRFSMKKLLDAAIIRFTEFREDLRSKIDLSEFHYLDSTLISNKLIPYDIEIIHPSVFFPRSVDIQELVTNFNKHEKLYEPPQPEAVLTENQIFMLKLAGDNANEAKEGDKRVSEYLGDVLRSSVLSKPDATKNLAALRIQNVERARQCRFYLNELIRDKKQTLQKVVQDPEEKNDHNQYAIIIQKHIRSYLQRNSLRNKELNRRYLIGMYQPNWKSNSVFETLEANLERRRQYVNQRYCAYIKAILNEKSRIVQVIAPGLLEDIGDEIREWFRHWYTKTKRFDKYPNEKKGGTILVIRGETLFPEEWLEEQRNKIHDKKQGSASIAKEKALKEKQKQTDKDKKMAEAEKNQNTSKPAKRKKHNFDEFEYQFKKSNEIEVYEQEHQELINFDNEGNKLKTCPESHIINLISDEECYLLQIKIRKQADELMRLELDLLERALAKDRHKKVKGKKTKKKKKARQNKNDLTRNRGNNDIFQELIDNGIIRAYPRTRLDLYRGDFSYKNFDLREQHFDPPGSLLDVRQAVIFNCILPIGVTSMEKPKSVIISGPRQSGKHILANAVFTETNCILFDLSPEITYGKYPGAKGLKMLFHMVSKMARILQPSVIFVDGCERLFYKKIPKAERELKPKRLGNSFFKTLVKPLKPADRVLVLGISAKPWTASTAKMNKAFQRAILIPTPDYNSVYLFWRELLTPYQGIDRNFNFSAITTLTVGYSLTDLQKIVQGVLNPSRIIKLNKYRLKIEEFHEYILSNAMEPITKKMYSKFLKWYAKTPIGKERKLYNAWTETKREAEQKSKDKHKPALRK